MSISAVRTTTLMAVAGLLAGCHSLSQLRVHQVVRSGPNAVAMSIWVPAPGPVLSDPPLWLFDAVVATAFYPLDVVGSTLIAVRAPFDPDLDISLGPLGAVCGIALPGLTLIPYIYPDLPLPEIALASPEFESLVDRVKRGDGVRAYREIVGTDRQHGAAENVLAIELDDPSPIQQPFESDHSR